MVGKKAYLNALLLLLLALLAQPRDLLQRAQQLSFRLFELLLVLGEHAGSISALDLLLGQRRLELANLK